MEISDWRKKINSIDSQLITLLNERAKYAVEIGKIKRKAGLPILDAVREAEVLDLLQSLNKGPLPASAVRRLFQVLMEETRDMEDVHTETPS